MGLIAAGGLVTATIYDVVKIANDERPSDAWAHAQAGIATPIAFMLAYETADAEADAEIQGVALFFTGWLAALGGFSIGSLAVDRTRSGGVGAAIGLAAASTEHATLTLVGRRPAYAGFVVQTAFAAPGVPAGLYWALDGGSEADVIGGFTLAGVSTMSFLQGVAFHIHGESEHSSARRLKPAPQLAMNCAGGRRSCTLSVAGTW